MKPPVLTGVKSRFLNCHGQNIHILEVGSPSADAVLIWHGVTGTAFDHVSLAQKLAHDYYVICPSAPGCGLSEWAKDKINGYTVAFYAGIAHDILDQLNVKSVRWIGHSKGGGVGIKVASQPKRCEVTHLVLNDYLPYVPESFRTNLASSLATPPLYKTMEAFILAVRSLLQRNEIRINQSGLMELARNWARRTDDGYITFHYDPDLANQFRYHPSDFDLWADYKLIKAKVMLMRAHQSRLTPPAEAAKVQSLGTGCTVYTRPGGHLTLMTQPEEQAAISHFLSS